MFFSSFSTTPARTKHKYHGNVTMTGGADAQVGEVGGQAACAV